MTGGKSPEEPAESAFDRFRRADPAHSVEPDLTALRAAVDRRIAADDGAVGPSAGAPGVGGAGHDDAGRVGASGTSGEWTDEEADDGDIDSGAGASGVGGAPAGSAADDGGATRAGRSAAPRGWVVAAAVATMLAVGTGGYIAGSQGPGSQDADIVMTEHNGGDDSADVSVEQDLPVEEEGESAPEDIAPMDTQEEPADSGVEAQDEALPPRAGPVQFIDGGLPTEARQGDAWIIAADNDDAEPVLLGEYPAIPAADAVARLGDPRFTNHHWPRPGTEDGADPPPIPSDPGAPLAWPVHEVRLVEAELTVGGYTHGDGDTWMLPTWILTDDQGQAWSVLAVNEDALDFSIH